MKKILVALITLLIAIVGVLQEWDPVADYLNSKWPPVSIEQQREAAISSTARALHTLGNPSVAAAVKLSDLQQALFTDKLREAGIQSLTLSGDEQLIRMQLRVVRQFTDLDATDESLRQLLRRARPSLDATLHIYAGITGAVAGPDTLELRLLPSFGGIEVSKVELAEDVDATQIGEALAALLNRYRDNLTGELARHPLTKVVLPVFTSATSGAQTLTFADSSARFAADVKPVNIPMRLGGMAWLVTAEQIVLVAQVVPQVTKPMSQEAMDRALDQLQATPSSTEPPTYGEIRAQVEGYLRTSFTLPDRYSNSNWVAIRKGLIATVLNSAVHQGNACVAIDLHTPEVKTTTKVKLPSGAGIDCSSDRSCASDRQCTFSASKDTRDCSTCLIPSPQICRWGKCIGGGGCVTRGNDPTCEAAKAVQNGIYLADANLRKADCDRLRLQETTACEVEKSGSKLLCEAGKETLNRIAATGNFANLDVSSQTRSDGLNVCLTDFNLSEDLNKLDFALEVQGEAKVEVDVKFVPLDIVGHLTCQFPWSKKQTFSASLRERARTTAALSITASGERGQISFATQPATLNLRLRPGPAEFLATSPEFAVSCPLAKGIAPLSILLAPFVKELRGDIDYRLPQQSGSLQLSLPSQQVGAFELRLAPEVTPNSIAVFGSISPNNGRSQ